MNSSNECNLLLNVDVMSHVQEVQEPAKKGFISKGLHTKVVDQQDHELPRLEMSIKNRLALRVWQATFFSC